MVTMSDKVVIVVTNKAIWLGNSGDNLTKSFQTSRRIKFQDIFTLTIAKDMGQANFSIFREGGGDMWIVSKWIMEIGMKTL